MLPMPSSTPACSTRTTVRATWVLLAASLIVLGAACWHTGCAIDPLSIARTAALAVLLLAAARVLRARALHPAATWMVASAQMQLVTATLLALSIVLASTNMQLQDTALLAADRSLGIEWRWLVDQFGKSPTLMFVLNLAYGSFAFQVAAALPLLGLLHSSAAASRFVLVWSATLAATVAIFPFVPALGGYLHFGISPADVPGVRVPSAWNFAPVFHAFRSGAEQLVDVNALEGIITFPSFHASAAVLLGWSFWDVRGLRWPMLILNGLMWISAVPMGGHYVTDVLAGTAVAVVTTVAVRARWPQEAEGGGTLVPGREPASSMDHPSPPPLRPAPLYR